MGRKRSNHPTVHVQTLIPLHVLRRLDAVVDDMGITRSRALRALIAYAVEDEGRDVLRAALEAEEYRKKLDMEI